MTANHLSAFEESVRSRDLAWLDSYDLESFRLLTGQDRVKALELIVGQIGLGDIRAPRALAEIGGAAHLKDLQQAFPAAQGMMRVEIARALARLGAFQGTAEAVIEVLRTGELRDRESAAYALAEFPGDQAKAALAAAAGTDRDRDVRTAAAVSLMLLTGIMTDILDSAGREILIRLDSDDPAEWARAAAKLTQEPAGKGGE